MKKRLNKSRRNGKSKLNIGTVILILGLILFITCFIYTRILELPRIVIIYYANLIGLLLSYFGGCLHLILLGDKPFYKSWHYIKESRDYILFTILIFLLGAVLALFYQPLVIVAAIKKFIEELLKETAGLNMWQMIIFILNNNLKSSFVAMLAGILLGIFPFFTALANGYVLGFVAEKSTGTEGISVLWRLFPHGIFELPAIFLALALGIRLGLFWFNKKEKNRKKEFLRYLENSLRVFLFVVIPLLVVAAIIEGVLMFVLG